MRDFNPREWLNTNVKAVEVSASADFVVVLTPNYTVIVMTLVLRLSPDSNILIDDNFRLIQKQVEMIGPCTRISATFAGLCFAVENVEER